MGSTLGDNTANRLAMMPQNVALKYNAETAVRAHDREDLDRRAKTINVYANITTDNGKCLTENLCEVPGHRNKVPILSDDCLFSIESQTNALTTSKRIEGGVITTRDRALVVPLSRLECSIAQCVANRRVVDIHIVVLGYFGDNVLEIQKEYIYKKCVIPKIESSSMSTVFTFSPQTSKIVVYDRNRDGTLLGTSSFKYNTATTEVHVD